MELVKDEKRVGRPILHRNPEKVSQIPNLIKENPRIGLGDIEEETGISKSIVGSIIKEDLQLKKTPSKFVPKMLTIQQKKNRVEVAKKCLKWWNKTLIGRKKYDPETKRQSMEWKGKDEPRTKKSRLCKSKNKVLLVTFFDINIIVHYEYLEEGQTINKESYFNIMRRVRESSIIAVYLAYWHGLRAADDFIPLLEDTIRRASLPAILGMDINAHSPTWGIGAKLDFRRVNLEELASFNDLHFLGPPVDSTWSNGSLSSSIDVTLASSSLDIHATRGLLDEMAFTDHIPICCVVPVVLSIIHSESSELPWYQFYL
ncbi:hypothetical protein LAZ67_14002075 [Cordylochernes scorpioides]|uniref:Endonuclease/exonuclease/phosphatase domain-containing protein n=1 Tax=Cordylochernes scorpioides TaxID=51811 RepID=A0ABY6LAM8_9ARAC|nr:hypothetical protein LAZ67_14002075 [Cordylochernes scorpioides]